MSREAIPNGHERSYRRGKSEAISRDKRLREPMPEHPADLPNGHGRSYDRGFEDGLKENKN